MDIDVGFRKASANIRENTWSVRSGYSDFSQAGQAFAIRDEVEIYLGVDVKMFQASRYALMGNFWQLARLGQGAFKRAINFLSLIHI